jgi:hypothetical protein
VLPIRQFQSMKVPIRRRQWQCFVILVDWMVANGRFYAAQVAKALTAALDVNVLRTSSTLGNGSVTTAE